MSEKYDIGIIVSNPPVNCLCGTPGSTSLISKNELASFPGHFTGTFPNKKNDFRKKGILESSDRSQSNVLKKNGV